MSDNKPTVSFQFLWEVVRPDIRQYKQQSTEFKPQQLGGQEVKIEIDVPLTHEYVRNSDEIISHQINNSGHQFPILTLAGYKYLMDQLESVYDVPETKEEDWGNEDDWNDDEKADDTEPWGDDEPSDDDDDWDDEPATDSDEDWNEDDEDWD